MKKINENTKVTLTLGQLRRLVKEAITTAQDTGDQLSADITDDLINRNKNKVFARDETRVVEVLDAATADVQDWLDEIGWWDEVPELEKAINQAISDARESERRRSSYSSKFSFVCSIHPLIGPFEDALEETIKEKFKIALKVNGIEKVLMNPKDWENKLGVDIDQKIPREIYIHDGNDYISATAKLESPEGKDTWFLHRLISTAVRSKLTEAGYFVTDSRTVDDDDEWKLYVTFKLEPGAEWKTKPMAAHDDYSIPSNAAEAIIPASKVRRFMESRAKRRSNNKGL